MSERLFLAATRAGICVPDDLSIIGFGPTYRDGAIREDLAVVAVDEIEIGRRAANILSEMSAGNRPLDDAEDFISPLTVLCGRTLGTPATA